MKGTKKEAGHILDAADISYFSTFSERTGYVRGLKSSGVRGCEARGEGTRGARDDMSNLGNCTPGAFERRQMQ